MQAAGFGEALANFVTACNAEPTCALAPERGRCHRRRACSRPIRPTRSRTTRGPAPEVRTFDFGLAAALCDSLHGADRPGRQGPADGSMNVLALVDRQTSRQQDSSYDNSSDAQVLVNWHSPERLTEEQAARQAEIIAAAPTFGPCPGTGVNSRADWPAASNPVPTGAGAPPILVVGTVKDPATPWWKCSRWPMPWNRKARCSPTRATATPHSPGRAVHRGRRGRLPRRPERPARGHQCPAQVVEDFPEGVQDMLVQAGG
ncbi:MAG: alpha/beta hydrolase [Desulfomicrobium escambiense]|nr:alpha/beta hydrolase [Desulfomicrobium escambiense]